MQELRSRRVLISGGGSGIGLEVARMVVAAGGEAAIIGRREEPLAAAARELGGGAVAWPCDVSDEAGVRRLAGLVRDHWGALDGLVNNAGVAPMAALSETDTEVWDRTFAINVRGPYLLCRELGPLLEAGDSPAVVNVSSNLAVKAIPGMAAYNSSKAALNQLTRSLALEWAPEVRVNCVMPGVVDTPIHASRGMSPGDVQEMGGIHPLGRVGTPRDVAALIAFLLSRRSSWMTGAVIPIDGGVMAG